MTVVRDGDEQTLTVIVGELPDDPQQAMNQGGEDGDDGADRLGLSVRPASPAELSRVEAANGVMITGVEKGPAARAGLRRGDVLVSLDGQDLKSPEDYQRIVGELPEAGSVPALVNRGGNARFLALKLGG